MQSPIIAYDQRQRRGQSTPNYYVYMVRVWSEATPDENGLRLTAEDTRTGHRAGFTDWEEFVQHLQQQTKTTTHLQ
ncbi:MAG: hypothetical protein GY803_04580 [Chloroflexi bacterium]|nr:hypothetical protein [Chloroflexota bacterium]